MAIVRSVPRIEFVVKMRIIGVGIVPELYGYI